MKLKRMVHGVTGGNGRGPARRTRAGRLSAIGEGRRLGETWQAEQADRVLEGPAKLEGKHQKLDRR